MAAAGFRFSAFGRAIIMYCSKKAGRGDLLKEEKMKLNKDLHYTLKPNAFRSAEIVVMAMLMITLQRFFFSGLIIQFLKVDNKVN